MVAEKHRNPIRDPAFIAYILGEETVQVMHCPQSTAESVEGRLFKSTTQQIDNKNAYKEKKRKAHQLAGKEKKRE